MIPWKAIPPCLEPGLHMCCDMVSPLPASREPSTWQGDSIRSPNAAPLVSRNTQSCLPTPHRSPVITSLLCSWPSGQFMWIRASGEGKESCAEGNIQPNFLSEDVKAHKTSKWVPPTSDQGLPVICLGGMPGPLQAL